MAGGDDRRTKKRKEKMKDTLNEIFNPEPQKPFVWRDIIAGLIGAGFFFIMIWLFTILGVLFE